MDGINRIQNSKFKIQIILIVGLLLQSCATSFDKRGEYHRVGRGETLEWIAQAYRVSEQSLAEENDITDPKSIKDGQKLYLPPRKYKKRFKRLPFEEVIARSMDRNGKHHKKKFTKKTDGVETFQGTFQWPVQGAVLSGFGIRHGRRHDGIDIQAKKGTPIHAAGDGVVVFSGRMRGYGNLILVKHSDGLFTAYAHSSQNLKKVNQMVKQGDVIAKVGMTGRATGPHLHFEVREGQVARNPLFFLPVVR